ncbi:MULTISPECIES: RelA/SpoT domain-containing protein [unclassified Flavobacterium]|uniref:RelA/SpoT domain-containing protein n=1 Tax=unclassified Flavobacterium TaxID=196869 RepID=UPI00086F6E76|nr:MULTISPECIES: RelA/SpoT domain-containing protein [unclassified Flavobacterium]MBN9285638.1 RelA/SpoT domain-containing protein [Flavobacterium sp.]ODS91930.1 MAG: (p)ppGpp synthetase [Chryseobacterium sp. SCN 40-13]OJV71006.1 MAG: (p)ppGpp synthetase [Flavobacterium sp. 40-81]
MKEGVIDEAVKAYVDKQFEYEQFLAGVLVFFQKHPQLNNSPLPIIHSIKSRLKDPSHLAEKLQRKMNAGKIITKDNLFSEVTDFIGVRILHLYQDQFTEINSAINKKIESGDWVFVEQPKAFTWDPESIQFYKELNVSTELRDTFYTSIHYLVKPNNQNSICCEIQVRTLFEEIWGEIDHTINYPKPTDSIACKEQLRVLSKLVSTGTRLADSIFRTNNDHESKKIS